MIEMKDKFVIIMVTCASKREAGKIAGSLVRKRLAGCANIVTGVESLFWWKGRVDEAREALIVVKTKSKNFRAVEREVKRLHSYDTPEIIAAPIVAGSRDYLEWLDESAGHP